MHRRRSLPLSRLATLAALLAGIALAVPVAATDRVIVVRPGDTLSQIALQLGVPLDRLVAWNAIADPDRIYAGQQLKVSAEPGPTFPPQPPAAPPAPAQPLVHVVRSGQNLTFIAEWYGTTIAAIVAANQIANPSYVQAGQRLAIPGGTAASAADVTPAAAPTSVTAPVTEAPMVHIVASGENLTYIANRYGTSISAIVAANAVADPSFLRVGQRLAIPGAASEGATPADMPSAMRAAVEARGDIRAIIVNEATTQGVPVAFALAVAWQESGWRAGVVSSAGAVGVMQLTPPTADWVAATMLGTSINLYDARSNVHAGVRLLRHYFDRYAGDRSLVLAAYFQGQTGADRHGVYPVTRPYIASVLALEAIFSR